MEANNTTYIKTGIPLSGVDIKGILNIFDSSTWLGGLWQNRDLLALEFRIVGTALTLIYLGSHAAIRRPPSARQKKKKPGAKEEDDDEADDEFVQGLQPSDAIMFPILAGTVLVGLYYLIKWLEDPGILNKILGYYFSLMSFASMGKLFADVLHLMTSLVFPDVWRDASGTLWRFDGPRHYQYCLSGAGEKSYDTGKATPLPGRWLSGLNLSQRNQDILWRIRRFYHGKWPIHFLIRGIVEAKVQFKLNDILGFVLAIAVNIFYQTSKSTFLSNVMGYAFSYTSIILMSPTTFTTGSAVLFGLFFYDIYMVFFTPYMVTVATKLDVPIKLVFEGPKKASMLGLGDIVVPGMFIGLCLRFDHYLYYHRQQKLVPVELETEKETSGTLTTSKETQRMVVKPEYANPQGQWGNRFWTTRLNQLFSPDATPEVKASAFPKTYFYAAMFGYFVAMMATLAMLLIFQHAQPALLYLVPGVVFSVWILGALRGELRDMWIYTEDGSLDKTDVIVEVDANGRMVKELESTVVEEDEAATKDAEDDGDKALAEKKLGDQKPVLTEKERAAKKAAKSMIFAFTIEAPAPILDEAADS